MLPLLPLPSLPSGEGMEVRSGVRLCMSPALLLGFMEEEEELVAYE